MGYDFSKPETKALYEAEVRKRMEPPFDMSREQAEMLVASLMSEIGKWTQEDIDHDMGLDAECWQCGGEGFYYSCQDEIGCVDPEAGCDLCERRCEVCNPRKPKS